MFDSLMVAAMEKSGTSIVPCHNRTWNTSITVDQDMATLWYNTIDGSTHIVSVAIGTKDYALTFTAAEVAMNDMLGFDGIDRFINAMENSTSKRG